jgi:putative MFS transporter
MSSDSVSVADMMDRIPVGPFHKRLLGICGSAWAFDGMEVIIISFTLPILTEAWNLSGLTAGLLGSSALLGMIAGNWIWGRFADKFGRKKAFEYTVLMYSIFAGLTAVATGFYSGFALRFLTGMGLGGALAVDMSYLSEHLPTEKRGRYLVYLDAFWPIGNILAVGLAWISLDIISTGGTVSVPIIGETAGWRILFASAGLPAFFVFVIRRELRETPYYLAKSGQIDKANKRIKEIAEKNNSDYTPLSANKLDLKEKAGFSRLFSTNLRKRTIVASVAWFGINFGYYGVFIWLPTTVGASGLVGNIYQYFILLGLVQIPGYLSAAYLIDRIGRKPTLGSYLVLSGLSTFLFANALPKVSILGLGISGFWPFLIGLMAISFFGLGAWGAIYAYTPELFPTEVRATGNGFAGGVGKIAAVLGPIVAGQLAVSGTPNLMSLTPLAVAYILSGVVVLLFGFETRGKQLT